MDKIVFLPFLKHRGQPPDTVANIGDSHARANLHYEVVIFGRAWDIGETGTVNYSRDSRIFRVEIYYLLVNGQSFDKASYFSTARR